MIQQNIEIKETCRPVNVLTEIPQKSQITHVSFSIPSKTRISLIAYMDAVPLECECQDTIQNHRNVKLI